MMWDGSHDMGWWMVLWMMFAGVAWVGLVTFLVYSIAGGWRAAKNGQADQRLHETPLEIASRRYASGDMSEDEYKRVRENLR